MQATEHRSDGEELTKRLVRDVHAELKSVLEEASLWDCLDYFEISMGMQKRDKAQFPNFEWLACAPVTSGRSHYIYIGTVLNGRYNLIFIGKTSKGFQAACAVANRCADELGA